MDRQAAIKIIRETFEKPFNKEQYVYFIKNLFNKIDEDTFEYHGQYIKDSYKPYIKKYERIGKYNDLEGNKIDILTVNLKKETSLERARTMQRNFIAQYLKDRGEKDAAIVVFYTDDLEDWRFSLVKMEYKLTKTKSGRPKGEEELTPARRYSFLVGKNEPNHTAQQQLVPLLQDDINNPTLTHFEEAFNIEKVTKEFFEEYRKLYHQLEEAVDEIIKKDKNVKEEFTKKNVDTVDFSKKLLGQIVFLYFLQKKGWLGVPSNESWDKGDKGFLRSLFNKCAIKNKNFFNDYLEVLFYNTLNNARQNEVDPSYSRDFDCRIPFLNGGLFEPINNYDWAQTDIIIPDKLFSNNEKTKIGDIGTGILDVFDRYNFTVKEDEPLEKEVAIDPEMLGKVFENLLEVKDRKSKGSYYTPREIVHYMCQESLINYLITELSPSVIAKNETTKQTQLPTKEDLETLINFGDFAIEHDIAKEEGTKTYKHKLPESIRQNAKLIDEKSETIRICDPACGSGAFLVGMMTEIVRVRNVLTTYLTDKKGRTIYNFKRHVIQNCLYGVDIDSSAVDIAKLRLWLSLVVDEEDINQIRPLPNLDYKIVCGNSLLGVEKTLENWQLFDKLEKLKPLLFNETNSSKKQEYKLQIDKLIKEIINNDEHFDFEVYFSEVFHEKKGFDVVIANPPYVNIEEIDLKLKPVYSKFHTAYQKYDLYILFFEKGLELVRNKGNLIFITSNKYLSQGYGLKLRQLFLKNKITKIINFNYDIFEYATVRTAIIQVVKQNAKSDNDISVIDINIQKEADKFFKQQYNYIKQEIFNQTEENNFRINLTNEKIKTLKKIEQNCLKVYDICSVNYGLRPSSEKLDLKKESFIYEIKEKSHFKNYFEGKDMGYWLVKNYAYLDYRPDVMYNPMFAELFENEKLVGLRTLSDISKLRFIYDNQGFYCNDSVVVLTLWHKLEGIEYSTIKRTITKEKIETSKQFSYQYLQAILNSRLIKFYVNELFYDGTHFYPNHMKILPIRKIQKSEQQSFTTVVDRILAITKDEDYLNNSDKQAKVKEYEHQIDQMVDKLYGLTKEEINIIENYNKK